MTALRGVTNEVYGDDTQKIRTPTTIRIVQNSTLLSVEFTGACNIACPRLGCLRE